ncbi:hypothetical protein BD626DRAFT_574126 [Schizophyllum amplum]|uniref:Homeobox domain-containing protein n=1 Tax=Schizophyllum amplum TaxID=97359 RepID=A0A550BZ22_9AGAR|nr:hypothetical protein BD626DRAFT_574126 [Auriculariopsis ampla]
MNVISSSDPLGGIPFLLDVALWRASSTECSTPPSYPPSFLGGSSVSSSTPPPAPPSPSHATRLRSHGTPRSPPPQRRSLGVGDGPRTRSRRLTDAAQSHRAFTKTRSRGVGTTLFVEPDEQQAALRDRLLTGVQDIAAVSNSPVNILQSNVLELVFANYTPYAHPPWIAALALVLGREYSQIKIWFNNNRQQRTPKGQPRRVVRVLPSHARHASDAIKAYAERAEDVARMTLEDFIEIVTAERDRQLVLLDEEEACKKAVMRREEGGNRPVKKRVRRC